MLQSLNVKFKRVMSINLKSSRGKIYIAILIYINIEGYLCLRSKKAIKVDLKISPS